MRNLKHIESFGSAHIPKLSKGRHTANYRAVKWVDLSKSWQILMYLTEPATRKPIDMSTVTLPLFMSDFTITRTIKEETDTALASECCLKKDWLRPEEDEAWRSL
jgi:hypothetical protein